MEDSLSVPESDLTAIAVPVAGIAAEEDSELKHVQIMQWLLRDFNSTVILMKGHGRSPIDSSHSLPRHNGGIIYACMRDF
jgi:hypothetical protein